MPIHNINNSAHDLFEVYLLKMPVLIKELRGLLVGACVRACVRPLTSRPMLIDQELLLLSHPHCQGL